MRPILLLPLLFLPWQINSQVRASRDLKSVVESLPGLIASGQFQKDNGGSFSNDVDEAITKYPEAIADAIPVCAKNLQSQDSEVRNYTLIVLYVMAATSARDEIASTISPEIANALSPAADETSKIAAMLVVNRLGFTAPDIQAIALQKLLSSKDKSERVTLSAAKALIGIRSNDTSAQTAVISFINDTSVAKSIRIDVLEGTAQPGNGEILVQNDLSLVSSAQDREMRDAAVAAIDRIGATAVDRAKASLTKIANDPAEPEASRQLAASVLTKSGQSQ